MGWWGALGSPPPMGSLPPPFFFLSSSASLFSFSHSGTPHPWRRGPQRAQRAGGRRGEAGVPGRGATTPPNLLAEGRAAPAAAAPITCPVSQWGGWGHCCPCSASQILQPGAQLGTEHPSPVGALGGAGVTAVLSHAGCHRMAVLCSSRRCVLLIRVPTPAWHATARARMRGCMC